MSQLLNRQNFPRYPVYFGTRVLLMAKHIGSAGTVPPGSASVDFSCSRVEKIKSLAVLSLHQQV